jgi:RNA polymerase sigma-70 factor, ECF subfamily
MAAAQAHSLIDVQRCLDQVARASCGRLLSLLAYRWQNLAAAEDALSDAFIQALKHWPQNGLPDSPEAWLMAVAQRQLLQTYRHHLLELAIQQDPAVMAHPAGLEAVAPDPEDIPDQRLKLLFVCAHPAIDAKLHTALMLQTVLGIPVEKIASVFVLPTVTLAQRLVRAKQKIKLAGIRFEEPSIAQWPERLHAVLEAIYALFVLEGEAHEEDFATEALYLSELIVELLPLEAEALGLRALLLSCQARKPAQYDAQGVFIPLHEQNVLLWHRAHIEAANELLYRAAALRRPGVFQIEAAIQSAHCQRLYTGQVPWRGIVQLYEQLQQHNPTLGATTAWLAALVESGALERATQALQQLEEQSPADLQAFESLSSFWLVKAALQLKKGETATTTAHYQRALLLLQALPPSFSHLGYIAHIKQQLAKLPVKDMPESAN